MNDITTGNTFNALPFGVEELRAENERLKKERDLLLEIIQDDRWNWHKTCRVCGALFRKIDGMWTGNHRDRCDFAKVEERT